MTSREADLAFACKCLGVGVLTTAVGAWILVGVGGAVLTIGLFVTGMSAIDYWRAA